MPIKILHLEDNPADSELLEIQLQQDKIDCEIRQVAVLSDYVKCLQDDSFDIILSDYNLPGFDGQHAFALAKKLCPGTPFIFVTGFMREEEAIESLVAGASDYVMKDKVKKLVPIIRRHIDSINERRDNSLVERSLEEYIAGTRLMNALQESILIINCEGFLTFANSSASVLFSMPRQTLIGMHWDSLVEELNSGTLPWEELQNSDSNSRIVTKMRDRFGKPSSVLISITHLFEDDRLMGIMLTLVDMKVYEAFQAQRAQIRKLQSIGQLAGGIAYEINGPLQYINNNMYFIREVFENVAMLMKGKHSNRDGSDEELERIAATEALVKEIPVVIDENLQGVKHLSATLSALQRFADPESNDKKLVNVNELLETVLTVTYHEWSKFARIEKNLAEDLPLIFGCPGELNLLFVELIMMAAESVSDSESANNLDSVIDLNTRQKDGVVEVEIHFDGQMTSEPPGVRAHAHNVSLAAREKRAGSAGHLSAFSDLRQASIEVTSREEDGIAFLVRIPIGEDCRLTK